MKRWLGLMALALLGLPGMGRAGLAELYTEAAQQRPGLTGVRVLETGEEALLARAWLAEEAGRSIDVQYFIWSSDNIGILAAESLLRAAEQGVRVRVLVDDLLVDAPPESLRALDAHPNIAIRIYNPVHRVGVNPVTRAENLLGDFRGANQRMHDKTFIVDGRAAIVGGRNMADEYFDYDHGYNFRDRDVLLLGPAVAEVSASFERFWHSPLAREVAELLPTPLDPLEAGVIGDELHAYAADPANFAPEVRASLDALDQALPRLAADLHWSRPEFLSDDPGKNPGDAGLGGGGRTTDTLVAALREARQEVVIQSPYLVLDAAGLALFRELIGRGVKLRIVTNSLAATDNLQAFSGYYRQRKTLLAAGMELREFRPDAARQQLLRRGFAARRLGRTVFALHAKTLVIDGRRLFIGTFNLDPRSMHLNTEVAVALDAPELAGAVRQSILADMTPDNSWDPARDDPDAKAPLAKWLRLLFWSFLPLDPLL